jgi:hypothetical protein
VIRRLFGLLFKGLFGFSKTATRTFWFGMALTLIFWSAFMYFGLGTLETSAIKMGLWVVAFAIIIRPHLDAKRNLSLPLALALLLAMGGLTTLFWVVPMGYFVAKGMKSTEKWWAKSWLRGQCVNSTTWTVLGPRIYRFVDWAWPVEDDTAPPQAIDMDGDNSTNEDQPHVEIPKQQSAHA